ncbi:hypothetical protein AB0I84_01965 [Streptomyces spectabilis]|uniref:hypothetical protein n=1 Tax=Streptomyces spectabilis TaxID=68270 RepID=UPI0033EA0D99
MNSEVTLVDQNGYLHVLPSIPKLRSRCVDVKPLVVGVGLCLTPTHAGLNAGARLQGAVADVLGRQFVLVGIQFARYDYRPHSIQRFTWLWIFRATHRLSTRMASLNLGSPVRRYLSSSMVVRMLSRMARALEQRVT